MVLFFLPLILDGLALMISSRIAPLTSYGCFDTGIVYVVLMKLICYNYSEHSSRTWMSSTVVNVRILRNCCTWCLKGANTLFPSCKHGSIWNIWLRDMYANNVGCNNNQRQELPTSLLLIPVQFSVLAIPGGTQEFGVTETLNSASVDQNIFKCMSMQNILAEKFNIIFALHVHKVGMFTCWNALCVCALAKW